MRPVRLTPRLGVYSRGLRSEPCPPRPSPTDIAIRTDAGHKQARLSVHARLGILDGRHLDAIGREQAPEREAAEHLYRPYRLLVSPADTTFTGALMSKGTTRRQHADNIPRLIGSIMKDASIQPPLALVAGLLMQLSVTLIYAREKIGKTTFVTWLMQQLALGLPIFSDCSEPQVVLYVSLEEGVHLVKMRAREMRIPHSAPIYVLRSLQHESKSPMQLLKEAILATKSTVVVVDSLSAYSLGSMKSSSPEAWNEALYPLSQMASSLGFSLIIIHHANKGKGEEFRGPTSIGAAVDVVANLTVPKGAPANVRRIRFNGRYGAGDLLVARDPQTGDYDLVDADVVPSDVARGEVTDEILIERITQARMVEGGATKDALRKAGGVKGTRSDAMVETLVLDGSLSKRKVRGGYRYFAAA